MTTVTTHFDETRSGGSLGNAYANYDLKANAPVARTPDVRFAFEFPELLAEFEKADMEAGRARDANRTWGKLGISLVLIALLWASLGPLVTTDGVQIVAGRLAALAGVVGLVTGLAGLRKTSQRDVWLCARLRTETLRLFHFYYIVARLPEIEAASSDLERQATYLTGRNSAFEVLLATALRQPRERLKEIVDLRPPDPFAHVPTLRAVGPLSETAERIMAAWKALRLDRQEQYCQAKLASARTGGRLSPRQLELRFSAIAWTCIAVVTVLHTFHVFAPRPPSRLDGLLPWIEAAILCAAMVALAARALEDGLKPQREVERYEQYLANIQVARVRFDTAADTQTRLEVMRAFEQTSMEEMRVFLRTYAKASYVL